MEKDKLPRLHRTPKLPDELTSDASETGAFIRVASSLFENGSILLCAAMAEEVHKRLVMACPHYKPDPYDLSRVMCASGSNGQVPWRGRVCALGGCKVSQVKLSGEKFIYLGGSSEPEATTSPDKLAASPPSGSNDI